MLYNPFNFYLAQIRDTPITFHLVHITKMTARQSTYIESNLSNTLAILVEDFS